MVRRGWRGSQRQLEGKKNMALNINLHETDRYRYANDHSKMGLYCPSRANWLFWISFPTAFFIPNQLPLTFMKPSTMSGSYLPPKSSSSCFFQRHLNWSASVFSLLASAWAFSLFLLQRRGAVIVWPPSQSGVYHIHHLLKGQPYLCGQQ